MSDSEYRKWWNEFRSRSDEQGRHQEFFHRHAGDLGIAEASTMVSVGPACGELDAFIISKCMPNLKTYYGLEPNTDNMETLVQTMKEQCSNVQVNLTLDSVPSWPGPPHAVDLVLATQVFWYFEDPVKAIRQFLDWLSPGGVLIIGHSCDDYIFARLLEKYLYTGGKREYWYQELKADLAAADVTDYEEYRVPVSFRAEGMDTKMLPFFVNAPPHVEDDAKMALCLQRADDLCKANPGLFKHTTAFVCVHKPRE